MEEGESVKLDKQAKRALKKKLQRQRRKEKLKNDKLNSKSIQVKRNNDSKAPNKPNIEDNKT